MNPKLVNFNNDNNLTSRLFATVTSKYFNIAEFSAGNVYDKHSTIFALNLHQYTENKQVVDSLIAGGFKVAFENLQEAQLICSEFCDCDNVLFLIGARHKQYNNSKNIIQVPLYFWYKESNAWSGATVDYTKLSRCNAANKKFLLMMNYSKPFRDEIYNKFKSLDGLISYAANNICLPGDIDRGADYWDRFLNVEWYNSTQFSIVVETFMHTREIMFITEKSMKPFAFKHPFMTLGGVNTLLELRSNGFETYENLFNETYDADSNYQNRIESVYTQTVNFKHCGYDKITTEKLDHNYNWFYNRNEVTRRYTSEILEPLTHFLHE